MGTVAWREQLESGKNIGTGKRFRVLSAGKNQIDWMISVIIRHAQASIAFAAISLGIDVRLFDAFFRKHPSPRNVQCSDRKRQAILATIRGW
jgi:hypothetical protein